MRTLVKSLALLSAFSALALPAWAGNSHDKPFYEHKITKAHAQWPHAHPKPDHRGRSHSSVQLGPRPYYLLEQMQPSRLKSRLQACADKPMRSSNFSIGHRGAPLQFPEHTQESYQAAARMGAGILECDVTFTKDQQLVCRHSQCDLHTTTNILAIPELAAKCSQPFEPADPASGTPASAMCCTSDITLQEFKSLCGKMDAANPMATTVEEYLDGTAGYRTDLYSQCATVVSHRESIELFNRLGTDFTPELKAPQVEMPFAEGYTQQDYAQQMIDEYKQAGVPPRRVFPQSFNFDDVLYWIEHEPRFGRQAVYLDDRADSGDFEASLADFEAKKARGLNYVAPPIWVLLDLDARDRIVPSAYAQLARQADLDIIAWSLERSGPLNNGGGYYYQSVADAIDGDGDMYKVIDVLAKEVGVKGIFSDWPATVTYYANCMNLH